MVHGISRSIRYIIKLKQPIDRFDTFLPLCSEVRYNLNLVSNNTKIEVFGERELDKRFSKVENVYEYFKKMDIDNFKKMDIDNEDMKIVVFHYMKNPRALFNISSRHTG